MFMAGYGLHCRIWAAGAIEREHAVTRSIGFGTKGILNLCDHSSTGDGVAEGLLMCARPVSTLRLYVDR